MAARTKGKSKPKRTTRKKKSDPILGQIGAFLMRYEVAGVVLILISALTLLSLITESRGSLTTAWIDALYSLVGIGIWGVPFFTGALGLWLIIFAIEQLDNLAWQRPAGLAMMLLATITGVSLSQLGRTGVAVQSSQFGAGSASGGFIGDIFATALRNTIGLGGAWAMVTLMIICGVVVFADRFLLHRGISLWHWYLDWRDERNERMAFGEPIEPTFHPERYPYPPLKEPRWKKWLNWGTPLTPQASPEFGMDPSIESQTSTANQAQQAQKAAGTQGRQAADTPQPQQSRRDSGSEAGRQESASRDAAPQRTSPTTQEDAMPAARIIGGSSAEWQQLRLPKLDQVLTSWDRVVDNDDFIRLQGAKIQETLALFGVPVSFEGVNQGPTVTQYLIRPGYEERIVKGELKRTKVKVSKIAGLGNDLALALAASSVRIEAPVPGTSYVGVEVPNQTTNTVGLRELMESETFENQGGKLKIALGEDVKGNAIVADMAKMPHLLIAGATGAGKSVCINSIISCLLCTHTPESLRMLMIDPKMVELSVYNRVPHLLSPVVTEVDKASAVLYWAVKEMERRYQLCSKANARDLERYNAYLSKRGEKPLPYILVIVDEMADLMMAAPEEVEKHICRLAQMARAVGIHLIIATQRPSVDVITGLIKANFPSRIAFAVSSQTDSRVILDSPGAERLLGKGDMLYMGADGSKLSRMQGTFLSDDEINNVVRYWKGFRVMEERPQRDLASDSMLDTDLEPASRESGSGSIYSREQGSPPSRQRNGARTGTNGSHHDNPRDDSARRPSNTRPALSQADTTPLDLNRTDDGGRGRASYGAPEPEEQRSLFDEVAEMKALDARDEFFDQATQIVLEEGRGSTSLLQRKLRIGYNRASRLIDQLEDAGIVGPDLGKSQGRAVLINQANSGYDGPEFDEYPDQVAALSPKEGDSRANHAPRIVGASDEDADGDGGSDRIWM